MVLVEEDPMVVHTSSVSATAWMLAVLADTPMPGADVATLLAILCLFVLLGFVRSGYQGVKWRCLLGFL